MNGQVAIKLICNRVVVIDAHVFGDWAAHPGIDQDDAPRCDWWVVTHVPNGRRIRSPGQLTEREAVHLARTLDDRKIEIPVYCGTLASPGIDDLQTADPGFSAAARLLRSVVFDTLAKVAE